MSNYRGYLLKAVKTGALFPLKYIDFGSWDSTPNAREEIRAIRDENTRNLTRKTAQGTKSSITFTTLALDLDEKMDVQAFFTNAEVNALERKIQVEYWNDEDNTYKTGYFYRPDIKFKINTADSNTIEYAPFEIKLVEY